MAGPSEKQIIISLLFLPIHEYQLITVISPQLTYQIGYLLEFSWATREIKGRGDETEGP